MSTANGQRPTRGRPLKTQGVTTSAAERARRAFMLRAAGMTWDAIARELSYANSGGAYHAAMRYGMQAYPATQEQQEQERAQLLANLDQLWRVVYPRALAGSAEATRQCLEITQRRLRLLGIDPESPLARTVVESWRLAVDLSPMPAGAQPEVN